MALPFAPSHDWRLRPQRHRPADRLWLLVLLTLGALGLRLGWLQLVQGNHHRQLADENRLRTLASPPRRGRLLDRRGEVLAGDVVSFQLVLNTQEVQERRWPSLRQRLSRVLHRPAGELEARRRAGNPQDSYRTTLVEGLTTADITRLQEKAVELPGVSVEPSFRRHYPHGPLAAHVLGYTSPISAAEHHDLEPYGYQLQDRIGRSGLEAALERRLRGHWGGQVVEVDAAGTVQRHLAQRSGGSGQDLQLTLDRPLQEQAEAALARVSRGAVVLMDARDGAILAIASRPDFDPNVFSDHLDPQAWAGLNSSAAPLQNRALQPFPPASTFKVITAMAALESGRLGSDGRLETTDRFCHGGRCFRDHGRFGSIGFGRAMAVSSNSFFYRLGLRTGPERIASTAQRLGLGSQTGIELNLEEGRGVVPEPDWKKRLLGQDWYEGDTINTAVGQGSLLVTPLQLARLYAAVGNGGQLVTPHLLKDSTARDLQRPLRLQPRTLETLRRSLREVVTSGTGTALASGLPPVAGKTGTAEDPPRPDHTWFVGFAPLEAPQVVVVCFAQNSGGFGGTVAAPIARQVLGAYFSARSGERTAASTEP